MPRIFAPMPRILALLAMLLHCIAPSPVPLSLGIHHLVDGTLLAATNNTFFSLGTLSKDIDTPLVVPEYPWEQALHFYTSLVALPNGKGWLLYYGCSDAALFFFPIGLCVAQSRDGRAWVKPLLNIHPYTANGTQPPTPTNIVFITEANTFTLHVLADARSGAIVLAYESLTEGARYVRTAVSQDGLAFSPAAYNSSSPPSIPFPGFADTAVSVTYDAAASAFVAFGRRDIGVPNSTARCAGANPVFRWIQQSSKPCFGSAPCSPTDAANWSTPALVSALAPGPPDAPDCLDNYNPAVLPPMPDAAAGSLFIALPSVMRHIPLADSGAPDERAGANDGFMDIRLAVSRNGGASFDFPSRDAFLRRGAGARDPASGLYNATGSEPDAGFVFATNGGLLDPNPQAPFIYLLYWGSQTTHAGGGAYLARYAASARTGIYRARLRREGWAGLASLPSLPAGEGSARTVALLLPQGGGGLFLRFNAAVDAAGGLAVALLDEGGEPLPGFARGDCAPLTGNGVRQLLVCAGAGKGGDLSGLAAQGKPVVLDLGLTHTTLFSWELAAI